MALLPFGLTDWTIVIYGLLALVLGMIGLIKPDLQLRMMGIEPPERRAEGDLTLASFGASSVAAINMGVLYTLGTLLHWHGFPIFTLYARSLMGIGFLFMMATGRVPAQFKGAAIWEFSGVIITGAAMLWSAWYG
ncbi:MAG: hypothetical protein ABF623_04150 [Gluconobacter cerinus]|uniref:hypothetical protein n=1 Tax=Gluconobacter cerinus TaxID=38307 RepID=UPI0039E807C2